MSDLDRKKEERMPRQEFGEEFWKMTTYVESISR